MLKKAIVVIGLLAITSVIAHLYVKSQVYHPVVRLIMPGGVSIAAVLPETKERKTCGDANERFLAPFKQQCKDCKVTMARCERELEGLELALRQGNPLPYPTVIARQVRVAFMGPADLAKISCDATVKSMESKGFKAAACLPPQKDAHSKS